MWVWTDRIGVILFDAALSTAVFLTFIVLAMLGCRQPARRILLARVALLASLAILPIVGLGRLPRLDVIDTVVESRFFPKVLFLQTIPVDELDADGAGAAIARWEPGRLVPVWLSDRSETARRWLPRGLTLLDVTCVTVGAAWLILGIVGVQWLIGRSRPPSPATRALFEELVAGRSKAAARSGLRVCPRLRHPVVTGLLRPMILIPETLERAGEPPEPLRLSLLHEIAHAERSDHWFTTAAGVAQAVWFFLPHVWWIRSQLLIDQEFLADRSAAERYGTSSDYASSLLSLATDGPEDCQPPRHPARTAQPAGTTGVQSPLFQRMMMLLHCPYPVESQTPRVWSWTSRLAVIIASIAAACLVIRWPQPSFAVPAPPAHGTAGPRFQVAHFVAEPLHDAARTERSLVYVMPLALPPGFDLQLDVRCTEAELAEIRIAGQLLGVPGAAAAPRLPDPSLPAEGAHADADTGGAADWHHVHVHRDIHHHIAVVVDGRTVPGSSPSEAVPDWLTIEPPSHTPAVFRKLVVSW